MKYLARSLNGQFVSIGNDTASARWYTTSPAIESVLSTLAVGDEVTFAFDVVNGKSVLGFLAKGVVSIPEPWASRVKSTTVKVVQSTPPSAAAKPVEKPALVQMETFTPKSVAEKPVEKTPFVPFEPKKFDAETSVRQTCLNVASNMLSGIMSVPGMTKEKAIEDIRYIYTEVLAIIKKV